MFSAKNAKFKETQKEKKDTICEHNCANCSCQSVRFFLHFLIFAVFFQFPFFFEDVFVWFPKSKNTKNKASKTKNNNKRKTKDAKQKQMKYYDSKTKQDNKQNNRNQRKT